nr:O-antigen ligase family protein [Vibrio vulnificus]
MGLSFLLFFSLFFNTQSNVIVFYLAFTLNLIYVFSCVLSRLKVKIEPFVYFYCVFLLWGILSIIWSRNVDLAINMSLRMVLLLLSMIFTINLNNKDESLIKAGYYGLLLGIILNVPLTFSDAYYISGRFSGTTINPNHISLFSGFVIFLTILNKRFLEKSVFLLAIILSSYLIFQTGSRKGLLLALVAVSIYLFKLDEKKATLSYSVVLCLAGFTILFIFFTNLDYLSTIHPTFFRFYELTQVNVSDLSREGFGGDSSTRWRLIFIVEAYNIFLKYPVTGIGLDNFKTIFSEELYSHNNYVELLSTLGFVGLILYYLFYFSIFKYVFRNRNVFCIFIMLFFLSMDFAMVSYFERMYILPLILIYFTTKRERPLESSTYNKRIPL